MFFASLLAGIWNLLLSLLRNFIGLSLSSVYRVLHIEFLLSQLSLRCENFVQKFFCEDLYQITEDHFGGFGIIEGLRDLLS